MALLDPSICSSIRIRASKLIAPASSFIRGIISLTLPSDACRPAGRGIDAANGMIRVVGVVGEIRMRALLVEEERECERECADETEEPERE